MNNSWMTDSNSTGFVYFEIDTTPTKQTKAETSDYMPFVDHNPSPQNRFNPSSYSSPQSFRRGTPRNFHKRGWKHNYGNRSFSPNTSYNSSYNSSRNRSRESNSHSFRSSNDSFNERTYASFLEDPWDRLEKQLEQKRRHESSRLEQNSSSSSSSDSSDCDILNKNEEQAT